MLEHEVRKIVRGEAVVGLEAESFLVLFFGMLPIAFLFENAAVSDIETRVGGSGGDGFLIGGDGCVV